MFRVGSFSKLMCPRFRYGLSKTFNDTNSLQPFLIELKGSKANFHIPVMYFCSKSGDGDKKKISSMKELPKPQHTRQVPQPEECKEGDGDHRKKGRRYVLLGILFAAATMGVLYYNGVFDKKKKVVKEKAAAGVIVKQRREVIKNPAKSSDIPKDVPYLLIGGGTASFAAFRAIKSAVPTAKVLVITNESFNPYMRPPLSKEIWFSEDKDAVTKRIFKQWNGAERSLFYEPDDFYTECKDLLENPNGGVAIAKGWSITKLDVLEKVAYLEDGSTIHYEKCLLATGATPRLSPVFQVAISDKSIEEKVKIFRNIDDFEEVQELFHGAERIAIIGGGFLGSELACAIARKAKKHDREIYQVFREGGNMGHILPEYLSYWTTEKVKSEGVTVMPRTEVLGIKSDGKGLELKLNNDKKLNVDFVIVAVGVEPNTELAKESDLEVDPELGGFLVNTELQARTDLYIAGDCACFYDPKLGRRRIEHHDNAVVTGRLAGENMTGARKPYVHQSMFWSDLGPDVGYEAIGIVDSTLPTVAVFAKGTDKDNPQAVVTATDEGAKIADTEVPPECDKYLSDEEKAKLAEQRKDVSAPNPAQGEDFGKGVIFYLRDDIVVGIVLWNVFNRMSIARQVLKDQKKYEDLNEVAKLFNIHEE